MVSIELEQEPFTGRNHLQDEMVLGWKGAIPLVALISYSSMQALL